MNFITRKKKCKTILPGQSVKINNQKVYLIYCFIDRNLICSHNMSEEGILGGDLCGLGSDIINMTCSIRFSGNVTPELIWTHNTDDVTAAVSLDVNSFTLQNDLRQVSTMTVQAREDMNETRFTCSVCRKRLSTTTTTKLKSWQSEKLNVLCK